MEGMLKNLSNVYTMILSQSGIATSPEETYNDFIYNSIRRTIKAAPFEMNGCIYEFSNPIFSLPYINDGKNKIRQLPSATKLRGGNYMARLSITMSCRTDSKSGIILDVGSIPIMVGSVCDHLLGMTKQERKDNNENEIDIGGYFIIGGTSKLLLMQEKLKYNYPLLYSKKGMIIMRFTSGEPGTDIGTTVIHIKSFLKSIKISFTGIRLDSHYINVYNLFYVLLYASKIEEAYELKEEVDKKRVMDELFPLVKKRISMYIQPDPSGKAMALFSATTSEFKMQIQLQQPLKHFVNNIATMRKYDGEEISMVEDITGGIFKNITIASFRSYKQVVENKLNAFAHMVAKFLDYQVGKRKIEDIDNWGNKRIVSAGEHMKEHFNITWKEIQAGIKDRMKSHKIMFGKSHPQFKVNLKNTFLTSFTSSTWNKRRNTSSKESNVVVELEDSNILALLSHKSRINTPILRKSKLKEKRLLHASQWGFGCPFTTPDGKACGLAKDHTILAKITVYRDPGLIYDKIFNFISQEPDGKKRSPCFVNGTPVGFCDGKDMKLYLLSLKRSLQISFDTSIILNEYNELYISTMSGRLIRPVLVIENGELVIANKKLFDKDLNTLLQEGCIEYIDADEQLYHYVYINYRKLEEDRETGRNITGTHMELDGGVILGIVPSTMPYIGHNQGPRISYHAAMGKKAIGTDIMNMKNRIDSRRITILKEGGAPIVYTNVGEEIGMSIHPVGKNIICAVMTYGGNNQEDAIIVNQRAIDRGLFKLYIYYGYSIQVFNQAGHRELIGIPPGCKDNPECKHLDSKGVVKLGSIVKEGDYLVGKILIARGIKKDMSLRVTHGKGGRVDQITRPVYKSLDIIKIRVVQEHKSETGDKYSSRYAQKGTIGEVIPYNRMPRIVSDDPRFNDVVPSILFNPHGMPSRMTIGMPIEMGYGLLGLLDGKRVDASPFLQVSKQDLLGKLKDAKIPNATFKMINGNTGELILKKIAVGPIYYQALPHLVFSKIRARGKGPMDPTTGQPVKGRRVHGGLRVGEMERDCMISHGAVHVLRDRFMFSSDKLTTIICACGSFIKTSGGAPSQIQCPRCGPDETISGRITIPHIFKTLSQDLMGAGIGMRAIIER